MPKFILLKAYSFSILLINSLFTYLDLFYLLMATSNMDGTNNDKTGNGKMSKLFKMSSIAAATMALTAFNASAAVELYNKDGMTFSTDALINVFYTNSSVETTDATGAKSDRDQSRVRMGFLPNNIGFNFSNQVDDIKLGARASFWVSVNDTDQQRDATPNDLGTGSLIDVRQFYGTISGDFGEVLVGKDFGLFNRANILNDELLLGHGQTSDFFGLVDGGNVSFGNISTGYTYPFPKSQITYRTPDMNGFKLAVGIMDPNKASATNEAGEVVATGSEDTPRLEAELMYSGKMDNGSFKAWVSGVSQSREVAGVDTDQSGIGYGANIKIGGFSLTASGYSSEGLGHLAGLDQIVTSDPAQVLSIKKAKEELREVSSEAEFVN